MQEIYLAHFSGSCRRFVAQTLSPPISAMDRQPYLRERAAQTMTMSTQKFEKARKRGVLTHTRTRTHTHTPRHVQTQTCLDYVFQRALTVQLMPAPAKLEISSSADVSFRGWHRLHRAPCMCCRVGHKLAALEVSLKLSGSTMREGGCPASFCPMEGCPEVHGAACSPMLSCQGGTSSLQAWD